MATLLQQGKTNELRSRVWQDIWHSADKMMRFEATWQLDLKILDKKIAVNEETSSQINAKSTGKLLEESGPLGVSQLC